MSERTKTSLEATHTKMRHPRLIQLFSLFSTSFHQFLRAITNNTFVLKKPHAIKNSTAVREKMKLSCACQNNSEFYNHSRNNNIETQNDNCEQENCPSELDASLHKPVNQKSLVDCKPTPLQNNDKSCTKILKEIISLDSLVENLKAKGIYLTKLPICQRNGSSSKDRSSNLVRTMSVEYRQSRSRTNKHLTCIKKYFPTGKTNGAISPVALLRPIPVQIRLPEKLQGCGSVQVEASQQNMYNINSSSNRESSSYPRNDSAEFYSPTSQPHPPLVSTTNSTPASAAVSSLATRGNEPQYYIGGGNGSTLIEEILNSYGWKRLKDKNDENWKMKWCELKSSINYMSFREGEQMVNHIPNCEALTNKQGLLNSLQEYSRASTIINKHPINLDFFPETYKLDDPKDKEKFLQTYTDNEIWICKPTGRNQGKGIFLIRSIDDYNKALIPETNDKLQRPKPIDRIVQRYIDYPLLINNRKFDIRCYMLIASTTPYVVLYHKGYIRLSMNEYDKNCNNILTHLTNQFIQKKDPKYCANKEETVWSMDRFNEYINRDVAPQKKIEPNWVYTTLTNRMQSIMKVCFNAVKNRLSRKIGYFELYGFDFIVDDAMKVWLLEININPSLAINCEGLKEVIPGVVKEAIEISIECFEKCRRRKPLLPLNAVRNFEIIASPLNQAKLNNRMVSSLHTNNKMRKQSDSKNGEDIQDPQTSQISDQSDDMLRKTGESNFNVFTNAATMNSPATVNNNANQDLKVLSMISETTKNYSHSKTNKNSTFETNKRFVVFPRTSVPISGSYYKTDVTVSTGCFQVAKPNLPSSKGFRGSFLRKSNTSNANTSTMTASNINCKFLKISSNFKIQKNEYVETKTNEKIYHSIKSARPKDQKSELASTDVTTSLSEEKTDKKERKIKTAFAMLKNEDRPSDYNIEDACDNFIKSE